MLPTQWHMTDFLKSPPLWNGAQKETVSESWSKEVICTRTIQEPRAPSRQAMPILAPKQSNLLGWMTTSTWHQVSTSRLNVSSQSGIVVVLAKLYQEGHLAMDLVSLISTMTSSTTYFSQQVAAKCTLVYTLLIEPLLTFLHSFRTTLVLPLKKEQTFCLNNA